MAYEVLKINNQADAQQTAINLLTFMGNVLEGENLYMVEDITHFFRAWSGNDQLNQIMVFVNRSEDGIITEAILTHIAKNPLLIKPPLAYDFLKVSASKGLEEYRDVIIGAMS